MTLSPTSLVGVSVATLALAVSIFALGVGTQGGANIQEAAAWSMVTSLPAAPILVRGHFGYSRWELPSPGGYIFTIWQLGLAPSIVCVNPDSEHLAYFSTDSILIARVVHVAWFFAFALALGGARKKGLNRVPPMERRLRRSCDAIGFWFILGIWCVTTVVAARYNMLSAWGNPQDHLAVTGSPASEGGLLYNYLCKIAAPCAVYAGLKGVVSKRTVAIVMLLGFGLLFLYSQRRLWISCVYICVLVPMVVTGRLRLRWLAAMGAVGFLGLGPLVWVYRDTRLSGRGDSAVTQAIDSVGIYATDSARRAKADETSLALDVRLNISSVLMGTVEYVSRSGAQLEPSFMSGVLIQVPTFIWPTKFSVADPLKARQHLISSGHFLEADIPVSPITEFVLQLGPTFGWIGGVIYGWLARLCTVLAQVATRTITRFIVWTTFITNLALFDSGTDALVGVRELVIVTVITAVFSSTLMWLRGRD